MIKCFVVVDFKTIFGTQFVIYMNIIGLARSTLTDMCSLFQLGPANNPCV
jgi:hypothetical protein